MTKRTMKTERTTDGNVFLDEIGKYAVRDDKGQRLLGVLYVNDVPFHGYILDGDKLFADLRRMPPNEQAQRLATKGDSERNQKEQ